MAAAYILIDFENVQPDKVGALGDFKVKVFVGAKQSRVSFDMANALQAMGAAAEYVRISGSGRNALDLHIAYFIGRIAASERDAAFHIISKDTDFDPLIAYLKTQHIACHRWASISDVPRPRHAAAKPVPAKAAPKAPVKAAPKPAAAKPPAKAAAKVSNERADEVIRNLAKRSPALPAKVTALVSTIKSLYRGGITDKEVASIVEELKLRGIVIVTGDRVAYHLQGQ